MLSKVDYEVVDFSDESSLLAHAKKLEGHTFREILELGIAPEGVSREYNDKRYKGGMGTLVEERYYGYRANSDDRPDFAEAGVELKTTCFDMRKDGTPSAGERLVLSMIPFDRPIEDELIDSHLWEKAGRILLIYYRRDKSVDGYDQRIEHVALFTPPPEDLAIMKDDYRTIVGLIQEGRADELSEGLTRYLGACTKGATLATMYRDQYYAPGVQAKSRAFCFKRNYMDHVLNHYLIGDYAVGDCIVKDPAALSEIAFEDYVLSLLDPYIGMTDREICSELGIDFTGNKAQWVTIVYKILGMSTERAEEFEKAGISVRTVRIQADGASVKESLSLCTFSFADLMDEEDWEESALCTYFEETRFFFTAFRKSKEDSVFLGARFWSMPVADIEGPLRECWTETRSRIARGVELEVVTLSDGKLTVSNNLPKKTENPVAHVRPHASQAAYRLEDGTEIGCVERDADELPDGRWMTKQSFWLNNTYVYGIVKDLGTGQC